MKEIIKQLTFRENEIRSKYIQLVGEIQKDDTTPFSNSNNKAFLVDKFISEDFKEYIELANSFNVEFTDYEKEEIRKHIMKFSESFGVEIIYNL